MLNVSTHKRKQKETCYFGVLISFKHHVWKHNLILLPTGIYHRMIYTVLFCRSAQLC